MHHIKSRWKKTKLSPFLPQTHTHNIQKYRKNKHVKHFISKASSSNCSGFLTLHWLFSIYFPKLLFFVNPLPWIKNQQKHCTITWAQVYPCHAMPWIPWQAQAQLDDAMKMYTHTHTSEPSVRCTMWVVRREEEERKKRHEGKKNEWHIISQRVWVLL